MTENKRFNRKNGLKAIAVTLLLCLGFYAHAQAQHREFNLLNGQAFQVETSVTSNAVAVRGKQRIEVNSQSEVTKLYKVVSKDADGYQLNVSITKLDGQIGAMGKKFKYVSGKGIDSASNINRALDYMVNKPVEVHINKFGLVERHSSYKAEKATDTLVDFAGIQPLVFEKGILLNFLADFTYSKNLRKGYSWTDDVEIDQQKLHTEFIIADITEKNTVIKFNTEIRGKLINSNTNGTYVLDNASGIIVEKLAYVLSRGYEISAGKVMYEVARSSSIIEKTKAIP
ncbi:hypothetical protein VRU48_15700 [Pedobacter sp. KR3-3]|uniref:Uncharacterized protein n=1 Tax=Pedobacter albus TaxID=3113905 RepID=A0ABU7IAQ4_9SPHI|nr:hypothetical protein [Pedobacter sp. KR3-3]MEE1946570.1 hypothetical protein [Pedobacter sp. KR3-3]